MTTDSLLGELMADEGCRLAAYQDTLGIWTIGYGHTGREVHPGLVWSGPQAVQALQDDLEATLAGLDTALAWWRTLDDVRQDVLADMAFNLGVHGLLEFAKTLADVKAGNYALASAEMLLSRWASEVGDRAERLAAMMKTGERP